MSEVTPGITRARNGWIHHRRLVTKSPAHGAGAAFDHMIAEVERAAAARVLEEAASKEQIERVPPILGQEMLKNVEFDSGYDVWDKLDKTQDPDEAEAITSRIAGSEKHKLIIDVDFPVIAVPSSTTGHSHLYIDKEIEWDHLVDILQLMADAGIVERGYADACEEQGFTTVRAPWVKKGDA